jgi:hypothetical protein
VWAGSTEAEPSAEDAAVRATLLAEELGLAGRAFVDGVGDEDPAAAGLDRVFDEIGRY